MASLQYQQENSHIAIRVIQNWAKITFHFYW